MRQQHAVDPAHIGFGVPTAKVGEAVGECRVGDDACVADLDEHRGVTQPGDGHRRGGCIAHADTVLAGQSSRSASARPSARIDSWSIGFATRITSSAPADA